jgi:hypothetical protein
MCTKPLSSTIPNITIFFGWYKPSTVMVGLYGSHAARKLSFLIRCGTVGLLANKGSRP